MKIAYVHAGPPEHGVSRYGRLLAAEATRRPDLEVIEREVRPTGRLRDDLAAVAAAGRQVADADVIHIQYNNQLTGCVWGAGWRQLAHLMTLAQAAGVPTVATVHDVYRKPRVGVRALTRHPLQEARKLLRSSPRRAALRWLLARAARVFVCTNEERLRLSSSSRVSVIPHFVEHRALPASRAEAKRALGLDGTRAITLLGYIHDRKGHRLVVDALTRLDEDVVAIFAGGFTPANSRFVEDLRRLIAERGLNDRVRITGYLPESELGLYLAATDLAVCPFKTLSASGSLSTWISAGKPILASDLPQIAEYNTLEPGAIATFDALTAESFAAAIRTSLAAGRDEECPATRRLRDRLLVSAMLDRHVDEYRALRGPVAWRAQVGWIGGR